MDGNLSAFIKEHGGKHGGLLYAQEKGLHVPNMTVWKNGEEPDSQRIHQICADAATRLGKVILRTSVPDDWRGIIDQMPTKSFSIRNPRNGSVEQEVHVWHQDMQRILEEDEPFVQEHAQLEGARYSVKDVTFSLAPYYGDTTGMMSEHPNFEDGLLIDVREKNTDDDHYRYETFQGRDATSADFKLRDRHRIAGSTVELLRMHGAKVQNAVRSLGIDEDMTYQFEFGWDSSNNQIILLQIREFCVKIPLLLEKGAVPNLRYFMGKDTTISLPILQKKFLDEFGKEQSPYSAYTQAGFGQYRPWNLQNNAQGIIVLGQSCLGHILAQPTISVMKREGFALLDVERDGENNSITPTKPVTVFHDPARGIQWRQDD